MAPAISMKLADDGGRKPTRRVAFTATTLTHITCPAGRDRIWIFDTKQPALAMMVTENGAKSFYLCKRVAGRPQRIRLDAFPDISIDTARDLAAEKLGEIAKGIDPMAEKREARGKSLTLGELWTWFLENWSKPRKRSWRDDEIRYEKHLSTWSARRVAEITAADIAALHQKIGTTKTATAALQKIGKTKTSTANRVLALLSAMYRRGRMIPGFVCENPCRGIEKFAEESRERYLSAEEIGRFFATLDDAKTDPDWRDFFKVLLFTGARRGNCLSMRWDELDLDAGRWCIPGSKFKNGKPAVVHLPPEAIAILRQRKTDGATWVFTSTGNFASETGHLEQPDHVWEKLCQRANLDGVRIHDLRRTHGSWQAAGGASELIIGKSLGHRSSQATRIYSRLAMDPVALSVNKATAAMAAAGKAKPE